MSKSRVAPLKKISIPRLELTSATVAVKVNQRIVREFDIGLPTETFYWTERMTVLRHINNSSARFDTFVANRVAVIQDGSEPWQWWYVSTTSNPADKCSRGLSVVNFLRNKRWTQGPDFLYSPESEWPKNAADLDDADTELSDDPEVKKKITVASVHAAEESASTLDKLMEYYSSWYRLKRAVSWILRVKKFLLQKVKDRRKVQLPERHNQEQQQDEENTNTRVSEENKEPDTSCIGRLTLSDLQEAERAVIKYVQQRAFHEEIKAVSKLQVDNPDSQSIARSAHSVKKSSPLSKLNPVLIDSVLRVGGRSSKSALPEETKFPIILPKKSHVTELILEDVHRSTGHIGRSHMLASLYKKFWVIAANSAARKIVHKCVTCRRNKARTGMQMMADLPAERLIPDDPPFTTVGLDYFGPFEVRQGRSLVKRYGVLFTCLTTRAIHLEKAYSLDTDSCINAFPRFVSRRGQVKRWYQTMGQISLVLKGN